MPVYFIQAGDGGPIKIGCTVNVRSRLAIFDSLLPVEPVVLGIMPVLNHVSVERGLHVRFAAFRIRNEWYTPAPELLAYIRDNAVPFAFRRGQRMPKNVDWFARCPDMPAGLRLLVSWTEENRTSLSWLGWQARVNAEALYRCAHGRGGLSQESVGRLSAFTGLNLSVADFRQAAKAA